MAEFQITVGITEFYVRNNEPLITDCSTSYEYEIFANDLDLITITLSGDHINERYIDNGTLKTFDDTVTFPYNTSLILKFSLPNSGTTGVFSETDLTIDNANNTYQFNDNLIRENDSAECNGGTTPGETGEAGSKNYIAVSSNYTVDINDEIIEITSNDVTVTLPDAALVFDATEQTAQCFIIKNSGTGIVTIDTVAGLIDDASTAVLNNQYEQITVISNGVNYIIGI